MNRRNMCVQGNSTLFCDLKYGGKNRKNVTVLRRLKFLHVIKFG